LKPVILQIEAAAELEEDMACYENRQSDLASTCNWKSSGRSSEFDAILLSECATDIRLFSSFESSVSLTLSTFVNLKRPFGSSQSLTVEEGQDIGKSESYSYCGKRPQR